MEIFATQMHKTQRPVSFLLLFPSFFSFRHSVLSPNSLLYKKDHPTPFYTIVDIAEDASEQELADFFCTGSAGKQFRLCGMYSLGGNYSPANCCFAAKQPQTHLARQMGMAAFP